MQIFQRYSRRKQIKFQYWWRCRFFIKYIQSFHRTRIYSLQNKFFEDRRWRVINLELYIEATSSFSFYIKKTLFLIMKMQSLALLRLLCRDSIRDTFADWNVVLANSGIYGFSPRAVVRSRISHATRRGPRLDLSSPEKDKREQEGEIVGVNFDRLNTVISKWKRSRLGHTISCCVSRHFYPLPSAPRRVLLSLSSRSETVQCSHRDKIQKIRGTFTPLSKRKGSRNGSCTSSTEVSRLRNSGIRRRINFRQSALFAGRSISLDGHPTVRSLAGPAAR